MTLATTVLAPPRHPKRLHGTPDHPAIVAGTAVWVGDGYELANPFEAYEHCTGPKGDWGVRDRGRFMAPVFHGWNHGGAAQFAVDCYLQEFDRAFPVTTSARYAIATELHCKDLVCACPLEVDGRPYPCHADELLRIVADWDELVHERLERTTV